MNSVLRLEKITKTYGSGDLTVHALKSIDLNIEKGVFYAIIGKSGSGKSTMLHILGALDKPTTGNMYLEGTNVNEMKLADLAYLRRRRIGFVFQSFNLFSEYSVLDNILMPLYLDKASVDSKHLDEVVDALGIRNKLAFFPDELSGGERQRVAIARALITKPAIILADEPTGNLDENNSKEVLKIIKESCLKFQQTIVLVTHDLEIASMADVTVTLADGSIISVMENNKDE